LLYSAQEPRPLFPVLGLFLIIVPGVSLAHLFSGWRLTRSPALRHQLAILLWATALAAFSGVYTALSIWIGLSAPVFVSNLSLTAAVVLLGYGVARYSSLIEGRLISHDFTYSALATAAVLVLYLLAASATSLIFHIPFLTFITILLLAVISHSLFDWARSRLERLLHRQRYGDLRDRLRQLARTTTPDQDPQRRLQAVIATLCQTLRASQGLIALREGDDFAVVAGWRMGVQVTEQVQVNEDLAVEQVTELSTPREVAGLAGAALVAPLLAAGDHVGAIVLGPSVAGPGYSKEDIEVLEECAQTLSGVVHAARLQEQSVQRIGRSCKPRCASSWPTHSHSSWPAGAYRTPCRWSKTPCGTSTTTPTWEITPWPDCASSRRRWTSQTAPS